jgi:hypothetical protein
MTTLWGTRSHHYRRHGAGSSPTTGRATIKVSPEYSYSAREGAMRRSVELKQRYIEADPSGVEIDEQATQTAVSVSC